jgi:ATP-dependent helicase HrpB
VPASSPAPRFDLAAIGAGLPVAAARDRLEDGARTGAMVVTAPPGTGKTTFVPPLIANLVTAPDGSDHEASSATGGTPRVLLTQPRRVAVRAAARRIAQLDGSNVGGPVGYTVRGERHVGRDTRLEVLTPGVLLRRLLSDPALDGVDAVVLDEVHERSVDGDLLLGMLAEVRSLREDLTVVAMSATLDADAVARVLGGETGSHAPIVDVPSPLFPLRIENVPPTGPRLDARGLTREFLDHLARTTARAHADAAEATGGDTLVFVPSARDVDDVVTRLRAATGSDGAPGSDGATRPGARTEVLPLHGRLPASAQDRATQGRRGAADPRRIIVSTALAESSLTVPGVDLVVDAGLDRQVRRDRQRDMTGLVTVSASRASVDQRAGRAARQGPGRAIRAYSTTDLARMPAEAPPEITSADLTDTALLLACWGTPGGEGLGLLTPPPAAEIARATGELHALGLTDQDGRPTAQGRQVAAMPVGVRHARALLAGTQSLGQPRAVAEVVAALSDDARDPGADLTHLLRELRAGRGPGASRWRKETDRLARIAGTGGKRPRRTGEARAVDVAGIVTALARPEWIARRTGRDARTYLLASGTRAALPDGSGLRASEWIAVAQVQRADGRIADGTGAVIRLAAPLDEDTALDLAGPLLHAQRTARLDGGTVKVREQRLLGAIRVSSTPVRPRPEDTGPALSAHLRADGLGGLHWTDAARSLRGRMGLLHRVLGAPWPAVDDASLLEDLDTWLGPELAGARGISSLGGIDVTAALRRLLPWPEASRLDELVPERLAVPSGSHVRITYPDPATGEDPSDDAAPPEQPVVAVKLQEVFGLATTPRLVGGRVPVVFHLLSPARRPLAVTDDLASFWNGPYQQVRKEMRGRYPKHPWPEDPWTAPATARTTRRRG